MTIFAKNIIIMRKYILFRLFIATAIILFSMPSMAQKTFGYLSYSEVLKSIPQYKEIENQVQSLKDEYQKEMTRAEQNFSKQFAEYIDGQKNFSDNIMMKRQKELQQLMEQSLQFKEEARNLIEKARKELMQPLYDRLNAAISKVGTEKGFDYILNTDGNSYPFINPEKGEDITAAVKALL